MPKPNRHGKVTLTSFQDWKSQKLKVFEFTANPNFLPIDFNLFSLFENIGWTPSDRLRFWYVGRERKTKDKQLSQLVNPTPHILIRKLDKEEDAFCHCMIWLDGQIQILGNDSDYAENFFTKSFVNAPPAFHKSKDWKIVKRWIKDTNVIAMFSGSLAGAMGWGTNRIPIEIEESLQEAFRNYQSKNWNSCVVMCRRALEAIMRFAYVRFFKDKPTKMDLNGLIREFEKNKPMIMPKHWINVIDSIRNIGNVPGAHAKRIKGYKFSRIDAQLALSNITAFREVYFRKIDKDASTVYILKIDLDKHILNE